MSKKIIAKIEIECGSAFQRETALNSVKNIFSTLKSFYQSTHKKNKVSISIVEKD